MSNYKVGDLASLMSSSPAKKTGSKLQSLFDEHWNKNPLKNAKKSKPHLKALGCDIENNPSKKMKKKLSQSSSTLSSVPNSPMKKMQSGFNSDFLLFQNKKEQSKERNSNIKRKRKNSFSENSAIENEKQNVVQAFIRCSKNKKCKTSEEESVDTISIEPEQVKKNLFRENTSDYQTKKQKIKKKSKQSYQNSINVPSSVEADDQEQDTAAIEPDQAKENLFREKTSNYQTKKQKTKKSKQSCQNSSNAPLSMDTEEQGDAQNDVEKSKVDASETRLQNLKDLPSTLFIGNLPVSVNRKMLHKLFASFGQIKSVRLRGAVSTKLSIPKKVAEIKSEYHKGLQSHTGFVVFRDEESAKSALSLNGTLIDNHHIVVDFANQAGEKKLYINDLSVFLGNLPFDVDDETVRSAFEECGEIHAVRIIRDKNTGLGKGFGYVQFQKIKSKEKALSFEDLEINGRKIRIKPIDNNHGKKTGSKKAVMMIRKNMATKRTKESSYKKSVKKFLKKGKQTHKKKLIARLLGQKFVE